MIGAGAMGSMFGGLLSLDGADVVLVDPWREHMEAIASDGLLIERPEMDELRAFPAATTDPASIGTQDVFIVLTKGFALRDAARSIQHAVGPDTLVVTLANGLGNDEALAEVLGPDVVVPGTTTTGSEAMGPGHIRTSVLTAQERAITHIGRPRTSEELPESVVALARAMTDAGLPTKAIPDADVVIWTKAVMACAVGPLSAALQRTMADVWRNDAGQELLRDMTAEILTVAEAEGVHLDREAHWAHIEHTLSQSSPEDYASMAVDVLRGRRTEIDSFSMEVVRRARAHGLEAPISATVGRMVRILETPTLRTLPPPGQV